MNVLGYPITVDYPTLPVDRKTIINTINPHSYCVAKRDSGFELSLKQSDVLLPDGIGIVWAAKTLYGQKIIKIAGFDIFMYLMRYLNSTGESCFFLGASEHTLSLIRKRARKEFPNVTVHTYSPPYTHEFTEEDSKEMCRRINDCRPKVVFVGMTAPKQEKWVHGNKDQVNARIICSIGAVFDFYAGTANRAPKWMISLGMEWLHRSLLSPRRLGIRNLKSNPEFIGDVLKLKLERK